MEDRPPNIQLGRATSSRPVILSEAAAIVRLSRGKIVEEWEVADELSLMKQVGTVKLRGAMSWC